MKFTLVWRGLQHVVKILLLLTMQLIVATIFYGGRRLENYNEDDFFI